MSIAKRALELAKLIESADSKGEIKALCKVEVAYLEKKYRQGTVQTYLTKYRKAIKDAEKAEIAKIYLRLDDEKSAAIKKERRSKLTKRLESKRVITEPKKIISTARKLLTDNSYLANILGIGLLTGRRPFEVAVTATFDYIDTSSVVFTGQAKTKGSTTSKDGYIIDTLAPALEVARALQALRRKKDFSAFNNKDGYTKFNNLTAKNMGVIARRHFGEYIENVTPYDLRAVYAEIAYLLNADVDRVDRNKYYADILGHSKDDVTTAFSYKRFTIKNL